MSSKTLNPKKILSDTLLSVARKNKAKSYSNWINDKTLDARIKKSDDFIGASTLHALEERSMRKNSGIQNSGYAKYLSEKSKSKYYSALNKSRNEQIRENAKTLDGYQKYVEKLENDRRELVNSTFKNILGLGITDVNDAYKRAKSFGLTDTDARAVARDTTSVTRTELFRKSVSNIIKYYYTSTQAKSYAKSIGLPESDVEELGKIADILNHLTSNQKYYSSYYADYINDLQNTIK